MHLRFLLLALFALLPLSAVADDIALPELFAVVGVASHDVLNIRSEPNNTATIIGRLASDAADIEVVAFDAKGGWAQINTAETSGWVARRFIQRSASSWKPKQLPAHLSCYGTEPFWALRQYRDGLILSEPDREERSLALRAVMDRGFEQDRRRGLLAEDNSERLTVVIQPARCSDGMSDRLFALNATLIVGGHEATPRLLSGCCSIAPQ